MLCIAIAIYTQRGHILYKYSIKYTSHSIIQGPNNRISCPTYFYIVDCRISLPSSSPHYHFQWNTVDLHMHISCVYIYHKKSASIPLAQIHDKLVVDCCIYQFITAISTIYQGWMVIWLAGLGDGCSVLSCCQIFFVHIRCQRTRLLKR